MRMRRPLDALAYGLMLVLCMTWGFQQVFIKMTAAEMPPVTQLATRFLGSALVFGTLMFAREGRRALSDGTLASGGFIGFLFAMEFLLLAEGLRYTTSAHAVVFLYTAPVFSALGLQMMPEERLLPVQWLGIAAAVAGIAIAFLGHGSGLSGVGLLGDLLALLGGATWGASSVALRRSRLSSAPATKTVFYQVFIAALVLGGYAAMTGQLRATFTVRLVWNLIFQTFGVAVLSYFAWFWLLRRYSTSRLMVLAVMTPIFGVVMGALIMGDPVDSRFSIGTLCVLAGILIVTGAELIGARR